MSVKVQWLDDFPAHWKRFPSKRLFPESKLRASVDDEQLSATQDYGVIPQKEFMRLAGRSVVQIHKHLDKRKRVELDDFIISMRSFQGGLERAWASGGIRSSYVVIKPTPVVDVGYFSRLFKSSDYIQALQATAHFIRDGQDLNYQNFCLVNLALPPLDEQKQIAAFLDYETAKIDALIEKQQQLIALLGEKRQAVISHAVTKGLNPDAPMRDSGIEWLGEVPEHWTVCGLGKVTLDKCDGPFGSGLKSEHYRDTGVRVIRLQNIKMNRYFQGQDAFIDQTYYDQKLSDHSVVAGDLLIAGLGDANNPVGRACVAPAGIEPAMVKADCFRYRVDSRKVNSEFLAFQLSASAGFASGTLSSGSTRSRIPLSVTASRYVAFSSLEEQAAIVSYVRHMRGVYSRLEECASTMVDRLQERRTALISAAVTGKIDVRGWKPPSSARMPETEMEVA